MDNTALAITNARPVPAVVEADGDNYKVTIGGAALSLSRGVDFGVIPGTAKPSLYKSGAEKIVMAYGIVTDFTVESAIESWENTEAPFFFYRVRCACSAMSGDKLVHITDGMGCANTREKQCGRASAWDTANARLKMAEKRALVDASIRIGQLSGMFSQDIENEDFMGGSDKFTTNQILDADALITPPQKKRIYALAAQAGVSQKDAKAIIKSCGYDSTSDIQQKDYDRVCAAVQGRGTEVSKE